MKFLSKSRWERKHFLDLGHYLVFSFLKPEEILRYLVWALQIKALVISSGFSGLKGIDKKRACLGNLIWVIGSMEPSRKQITVNSLSDRSWAWRSDLSCRSRSVIQVSVTLGELLYFFLGLNFLMFEMVISRSIEVLKTIKPEICHQCLLAGW